MERLSASKARKQTFPLARDSCGPAPTQFRVPFSDVTTPNTTLALPALCHAARQGPPEGVLYSQCFVGVQPHVSLTASALRLAVATLY